MHDDIGFDGADQLEHSAPIPDVQLVMLVAGDLLDEPLLVPPRVPLRTEEYRTLVIINTVDFEAHCLAESGQTIL